MSLKNTGGKHYLSILIPKDCIGIFSSMITSSAFETTFIKTANEEFLQYIDSFYEELKKHTVKELYDRTIQNMQ